MTTALISIALRGALVSAAVLGLIAWSVAAQHRELRPVKSAEFAV